MDFNVFNRPLFFQTTHRATPPLSCCDAYDRDEWRPCPTAAGSKRSISAGRAAT